MKEENLIKIENEISNVATTANPSIKHILEAQIQILKFIREPKLMVHIVDIMLQNLEMSLRYASDESEQKWLKEETSIAIQNFLFLLHAMMIYEINENREEGIRLLKEAGSMVGNAIVKTLTHCATGAINTNQITKNIVNAIMDDNGKTPFWSRFIDFYNKKEKMKRKKNDFFNMVEKTLFKIDRRKALLGKSVVLSEMLYNYIDYIDAHKNEIMKQTSSKTFRKLTPLWSLIFLPIIALTCLVFLYLFALIPSKLFDLNWSLQTWNWITAFFEISKWSVIFFFGIPILGAVSVLIARKTSSMKLMRRLKSIAIELDPHN